MNSGKQETIETIEGQILHAKLFGIDSNEGYTEQVCGTYNNIIEYCKKNKFEVGHYYDYAQLNNIPGDGYFEWIGPNSNE